MRSLIAVQRIATVNKLEQTTDNTRYFLSDIVPEQKTAQGFANLIRGHWGGVEIRNHWIRDAILKEDATRTRNANICGVIALLAGACVTLFTLKSEQIKNTAAFTQAARANPKVPFRLIAGYTDLGTKLK